MYESFPALFKFPLPESEVFNIYKKIGRFTSRKYYIKGRRSRNEAILENTVVWDLANLRPRSVHTKIWHRALEDGVDRSDSLAMCSSPKYTP